MFYFVFYIHIYLFIYIRIYIYVQVELLEPCLPNLENLQLGFNYFKILSSRKKRDYENDNNEMVEISKRKVKGFLKLKVLNLESDAISLWDEIARFSELPK